MSSSPRTSCSSNDAGDPPPAGNYHPPLRPYCEGDPADFLQLGQKAGMAAVIVVSPDCWTESLTQMGFRGLHFVGDNPDLESWQTCDWDGAFNLVILLVRADASPQEIKLLEDLCLAVTLNDMAPPTVATVLPKPDTQCDSPEMLELERSLLDSRADDVVILTQGESLTPTRVHLIIVRTELMAERAKRWTEDMVNSIEDKARNTLKSSSRKLLWSMPGSALRNLPSMNADLKEWQAPPGSEGPLGGVGEITLLTPLGRGSYGTVYRATHPERGTMAVKVFDKKTIKSPKVLVALDKEFCTMLNLAPHPNVVSATAAFHAREAMYLCMEYAGTQNLHEYASGKIKESGEKALPLEVALWYVKQAAVAVGYLHKKHVCHRDIKPNNFIVSEDGTTIRLGDYGLAALVLNDGQTFNESVGSLPFCAPEVLRNAYEKRPYGGFAADVWSLGLNFLEIMWGPWTIMRLLNWDRWESERKDLKKKVVQLESLEDTTLQMQMHINEGIRATLMHMLVAVPASRWSLRQILGSEGMRLPDYALAGLTPAKPKGGPPRSKRPANGYANLVQGNGFGGARPRSAGNVQPGVPERTFSLGP
eukprot:TRINITY_DN3917_c0_g1_i1.p1 TRINITY_DN3917_c0_g1~~TRINITY_DN3917_c0_g1_i1.p1  ORF type:complete len:591 (-),score=106.15 TRINITY_DN3917_c0_g1_i1:342-2114(-)